MDGDMLGLTIMDCPELKRCPILINFHSDFNGKITIFNRKIMENHIFLMGKYVFSFHPRHEMMMPTDLYP